jgi:hypothetical protein
MRVYVMIQPMRDLIVTTTTMEVMKALWKQDISKVQNARTSYSIFSISLGLLNFFISSSVCYSERRNWFFFYHEAYWRGLAKFYISRWRNLFTSAGIWMKFTVLGCPVIVINSFGPPAYMPFYLSMDTDPVSGTLCPFRILRQWTETRYSVIPGNAPLRI